ncbi:hypothetical protein [Thalassovita aquimarina]|uniref:Lipoprotein n=1 Tax=Thalassovita aquimarina TaxID=2785917 RepID=A0ABS5HRL7_9RHOB|nr:hypothetical protein [Thalassovita aquimarina]MBR9651625.1 hypothetical protein [Thalassovita aquimarina]
MHAPLVPILMLSLTGLAGCAATPELNERIEPAARTAPYPALIPLDDVTGDGTEPRITDSTAAELQARARALRVKAAKLRELAGS